METFVVSDLHLMDRQESFLFNAEKEKVFNRLGDIITERNAQLVMAGDIFDLTGMSPCCNGQREFFTEALPEECRDAAKIERVSQIRSTTELLKSTQKTFPDFFKTLARLARQKKLIYIPGNHDCEFLHAHGQLILSQLLQVEKNDITWQRRFEIPGSLLVVHGNEFDGPNRTNHNCQNPGYVFTSAMYHAVLPALDMLGVNSHVLSAIPAVRPEEETVIGMQHYLGEEATRRVLIALVRLLQRNGFFRGWGSIPAWFLNHDFPLASRWIRKGVTPERIRAILPQEDWLMKQARLGAKKLRAHSRSQSAEMIVMGHTHELDLQTDYLNLGTWIDHIDGLTPEKVAAAEISLPVFIRKESGEAMLYDCKELSTKGSLESCPVKWTRSFPVATHSVTGFNGIF
jgi:UDP-2,3-diacylglucosamine pyrophosphatase LpxH